MIVTTIKGKGKGAEWRDNSCDEPPTCPETAGIGLSRRSRNIEKRCNENNKNKNKQPCHDMVKHLEVCLVFFFCSLKIFPRQQDTLTLIGRLKASTDVGYRPPRLPPYLPVGLSLALSVPLSLSHTHTHCINYNIHIVPTVIPVAPLFFQALTGATATTAVGSAPCGRFSGRRWPGVSDSAFFFSFLSPLRSHTADVVPPSLLPLRRPATVARRHWHQKGRGGQAPGRLQVRRVW